MYKDKDIRGFNKAMSKRVPSKNGIVNMNDVMSELEEVFKET